MHSKPGKVSYKSYLRSKPLTITLLNHEHFLQMQETQLCPCIPSIPSQAKMTLGELGGEGEDRKNRKEKQQGVLSTYD